MHPNLHRNDTTLTSMNRVNHPELQAPQLTTFTAFNFGVGFKYANVSFQNIFWFNNVICLQSLQIRFPLLLVLVLKIVFYLLLGGVSSASTGSWSLYS